MPNYQRIIVEGHVAKGPEIQQSKNGKTYVKFSVPWERKNSWGEGKETIWFQILAFHNLAREVADTFHKGDPVHVEGMLSVSAFTDRNGDPRASLTIMAQSVEPASRGGCGETGDGGEDMDLPF